MIFSRFAEVFSVHLRVDNVETSVRASKKQVPQQNHFREWGCRGQPQPIVVLGELQSSERTFF